MCKDEEPLWFHMAVRNQNINHDISYKCLKEPGSPSGLTKLEFLAVPLAVHRMPHTKLREKS